MMKRKLQLMSSVLAMLFLTSLSASAQTAAAKVNENDDTEIKLIDAKVVEVTDERISVFARSGVEHVIAINRKGTKVTIEGQTVSLQDVREGDLITIELDEANPVKFAKNISLKSTQEQVARVRH